MPIDPEVHFGQSLKDFDDYPSNLARDPQFRHTLDDLAFRFQCPSRRVFKNEGGAVTCWDFWDGFPDFRSTQWNSLEDVKKHLGMNRKDPICRYIFINARNSRAPLNCSKQMLAYILSYHQVMSWFLNLVFAFGEQFDPVDFYYSAFRGEDISDSTGPGNRKFGIPRLGRSGHQYKLVYNLHSIERSHPSTETSWSVRKTAVYHSFDIIEGRAFWIIMAANNLIQDRLKMVDYPFGDTECFVEAFGATLTTHLIPFQWCDEGWREYIAGIETELRDCVKRANSASIDVVQRKLDVDEEELIKSLCRDPGSGTNGSFGRAGPSNHTAVAPGTQNHSGLAIRGLDTALSFGEKPSPISMNMATTTCLPSPPLSPRVPISPIIPEFQNLASPKDEGVNFETLKQFSYKRLQTLNRIRVRLHEAALILKLNAKVLRHILTHYSKVIQSPLFPSDAKLHCHRKFDQFDHQVVEILGDLEAEQARMETLLLLVDDAKEMFNSILRFRNMEMNKLFAVGAHVSAERNEKTSRDMRDLTVSMHSVAEKTQKETASMHIITLVTLIFLPATFLATFFGSGLFQWDDDGLREYPMWKGEFFKLFLRICAPLMGIIMMAWVGFWYSTRRARCKAETDLEKSGRQE